MADHEDYQPGEAPAAHAPTHEDGGPDQVGIAGLLGTPAALATHALLPTVHQDAPGLIGAHALLAGIHHLRYTDVEASAAATILIGIHAALPTVHQDAPALIGVHALLPGVHHLRYTDAEARALLSPISMPPASFRPLNDLGNFTADTAFLRNRTSLSSLYYFSPVIFPPGVTVTKLTLYGYRDDALAVMHLRLYRIDRVTGTVTMASILAAWVDGDNDAYDDIIVEALIDNDSYSYVLSLRLDPNDSVLDVKLFGVKIDFTG